MFLLGAVAVVVIDEGVVKKQMVNNRENTCKIT